MLYSWTDPITPPEPKPAETLKVVKLESLASGSRSPSKRKKFKKLQSEYQKDNDDGGSPTFSRCSEEEDKP